MSLDITDSFIFCFLKDFGIPFKSASLDRLPALLNRLDILDRLPSASRSEINPSPIEGAPSDTFAVLL